MNDEAAATPPRRDTPPQAGTQESPPPADFDSPPPGGDPPFTGGIPFFRDKMVRPRQDRYVAGVCTALARATNTDPVLWRVLAAVLAVISGVGVLLYLIGWLVIPAEGDTASPIESLLGKGRSGMAPLSVIVLGAAAVLTFAFIVDNPMRGGVLAVAVVLGAILLIKRSGPHRGTGAAATFPAPPADTTGPDAASSGAGQPAAYGAMGFPPPTMPPSTDPTLAARPPTDPTLTMPPAAPGAGYQPPFAALGAGYRQPFAPHGPWATATPPPAPTPVQPPHPRKPPRERSKLGRATFFAVLVVIGLMAVSDMAGANITIAGYFAAALVTISLGLIVGAWFGRARGLIALALLASVGLLVSTGAESFGGQVGSSVYRPHSIGAVADRYDFAVGNATLDLRDVDFTNQQQDVTLTMKLGQIRVLLPATVDTSAELQLKNGQATILGRSFEGREVADESVTDLGSDGTGGGTLHLDLQMDTGKVEVIR